MFNWYLRKLLKYNPFSYYLHILYRTMLIRQNHGLAYLALKFDRFPSSCVKTQLDIKLCTTSFSSYAKSLVSVARSRFERIHLSDCVTRYWILLWTCSWKYYVWAWGNRELEPADRIMNWNQNWNWIDYRSLVYDYIKYPTRYERVRRVSYFTLCACIRVTE